MLKNINKLKIGGNMDKQKEKKQTTQNNEFNIDTLKSFTSCELDIKNLQKLSEKVEQTGLASLVGLSKKIVSFYKEVETYCEKNKFKITDYFNLNSIRQKLYKLVGYPQLKDADGKPIRNYVFENAVSRSIKLAFVLINKDKTKAEIKDNVVFAQSNIIYPYLKTTGNSDIKFTPNTDTSLIKVSTRGLELLWNSIKPVKTLSSPTQKDDEQKVLDTLKNIRAILNNEMQNRNKKSTYLVDTYGTSEIEQLTKISQFALRLIEQYARDNKDFDANGKMKTASIINVESVEFKVVDEKRFPLTRVSKSA
tara:strand:+ start:182 stop:1105 length:924 start_codon:yes stop_codon:yes gene_type:complete